MGEMFLLSNILLNIGSMKSNIVIVNLILVVLQKE